MNDVYTLPQLFSGHLFRVPDYQRGYAWEAKQCSELLEDLEALPIGKRHHFGTVTLQMCADRRVTDAAGTVYDVLDIVDGQQRVTSLVILLDAIRRELETLGDQAAIRKAHGIRQTYIATEDGNLEPLPKLTLNSDCQPLFYTSVLELGASIDGPRIRSHELLLAAKAHFAEYLKQRKDECGAGYGTWLEELRVKLTQQLTFLMYPATDDTDAGVLFETMNNRGKRVTELELVKNYLLYVASNLDVADHNLPAAINKTWSKLYESLMEAGLAEPDDEEQLLRAHWLMTYDNRRENWQKSGSIKSYFNLKQYRDKHQVLLQDLREYLATLSNAVTALLRRKCTTSPGGIQRLPDPATGPRRGGQADCQAGPHRRCRAIPAPADRVPPGRGRRGGIRDACPLVRAICLPRIQVRWRSPRNPRERALSTGPRSSRGYESGQRHRGVKRLVHYYCPDSRLESGFDIEGANWFRWSGLKYFLYEYEEHLAGPGLAVSDKLPWIHVLKRSETIEHILPQHPAEGGYWDQHWTQVERDTWTHDFGNLCLTYDNSWLSNRPFPEKRAGDPRLPVGPGYAKSFVFQEKYLAGYADWSLNELKERRQAIKEWAVERWKVDRPQLPPPATGLARIQQIADGNGIGDVFRSVVEEAERLGLYLRPHKLCVVLAPPGNKNRAVFAIWPKPGKLQIGQWFTEIDTYLKVPPAEAKRILGDTRWRYVDGSSAGEFVDDLRRLMP